MDLRQGWRLDAPSMGAALSYYALFSIAPLLLIVIGVAGYFFGEEAARARCKDWSPRRASRKAACSPWSSARRSSSAAPEKAKGGWTLLRTRVLSFGMILAIAFLLMVSLVLSAAIAALGRWWGLHLIDMVVSFALTTLLFAMIYKFMPRLRIAWRDVWVGAALTAALFAVGKWAIGLYIGRSSVGSAFGAAGSLVVLMVWVYYSAQIFLLGAEFTRVYAEEQGSRATAPAAATPSAINPARPGRTVAKLGAALALGIGASLGFNFWRRR